MINKKQGRDLVETFGKRKRRGGDEREMKRGMNRREGMGRE